MWTIENWSEYTISYNLKSHQYFKIPRIDSVKFANKIQSWVTIKYTYKYKSWKFLEHVINISEKDKNDFSLCGYIFLGI